MPLVTCPQCQQPLGDRESHAGYVLEWYELKEPDQPYYANYSPDGEPRGVTRIEDADVYHTPTDALTAAPPFLTPRRFIRLVPLPQAGPSSSCRGWETGRKRLWQALEGVDR
jgi:hypothetical protein